MFLIRYTNIWPNLILILPTIQGRCCHQRCNLHYTAISMMTSHILKFTDFTKSRKSKYFENETLSFIQINYFIKHQGLL